VRILISRFGDVREVLAETWSTAYRYPAYETYVYAVRSNRIDSLNLLPPEFPLVRGLFPYHYPDKRIQFVCPGRGLWNAYHETMFQTVDDAIHQLLVLKELFWCSHCGKPLFFPCSCQEHRDCKPATDLQMIFNK
jgi:hypothetical protein